jgi:aminoglycoside phosphotransferase (APT) family kinase protein
MLELTEQNAAEVLHAAGHLADPRQVRVRELSGGVSNVVLLIEQPPGSNGPERFIVKQARGKLRVQADWRCSVERIWREVEVLQAYGKLLHETPIAQSARVPEVLWNDRDLYAYAMTAAAPESVTWKEKLLAGDLSTDAENPGALLGELHAQSWGEKSLAEQFDDRTYFIDLRLDPYYRFAAKNHAPLARQLNELAEQTLAERHALVHGDFSPKNLLVSKSSLLLIDFEVGHHGDPAFDVGFCLCHLVLKAIHLRDHSQALVEMAHQFWKSYDEALTRAVEVTNWHALDRRIAQNLAGCLVARVHGKSPVEYLTPAEKERAVRLAELIFGLGFENNQELIFHALYIELLMD